MPIYDYECHDCLKKLIKAKGTAISVTDFEDSVVFETSHMMNPTPEELKEATECPRCGGHNCEKYIGNINITTFVRGNGFLDKAGAHRDMNLFHLTNDDPYAEYRVAGEVDELKTNLKKGGKHNPKTKYYQVKSEKKKPKDKK